MGNTLIVSKFSEYKSIDKENLLKETQEILKSIPNSELPTEMLKTTVKSMAEGLPVVSEVCKTINGWVSLNARREDDMSKFVNELKFIEQIKTNDDYIKSYILYNDDDINTIWVIIEESIFAYNRKYLKLAREFKSNNNCEFNLSIFDKDDVDGINEQLKYVKVYEG